MRRQNRGQSGKIPFCIRQKAKVVRAENIPLGMDEEHSVAGAKRKVAEAGDQEKAAARICETARDIETVGMVGAGEVNNSYISRTAR